MAAIILSVLVAPAAGQERVWGLNLLQRSPAAREELVPRPAEIDETERSATDRRVPEELPNRERLLAAVAALEGSDRAAQQRACVALLEILRRPQDAVTWTTAERWMSAKHVSRALLNRFPQDVREAAIEAVWSDWKDDVSRASGTTLTRLGNALPVTAESDLTRRRLARSVIQRQLDAGQIFAADVRLSRRLAEALPGKLPSAWGSLQETVSALAERASVADSKRLSKGDVAADAFLPIAAWRQEFAASPAITAAFEELSQRLDDMRVPLLPAWRPAFSGEAMIQRTPEGMVCVDTASGVRRWTLTLPDSLAEGHRREQTRVAAQQQMPVESPLLFVGEAAHQTRFANLVCLGGPGGQLTAAGGRVFVVLDEAVVSDTFNADSGLSLRQQQRGVGDGLSSNVLRAVDAETGRTLWELGGVDHESPFDRGLAGTFFLGPPTPRGDELLILGERRAEVALLRLSAETGEVRARLPVAVTDAPINLETARRFWSSEVVESGGVAYFDTSVGWVGAVDLSDGEFLWITKTSGDLRKFAKRRIRGLSDVGNRWRPTPPVVAGRYVWFFPQARPAIGNSARSGSARLSAAAICVDRVTGKVVSEIMKGDAILVAAVLPDRLILASRTELRAYAGGATSIAERPDPELLWSRDLGGDGSLAGRPLLLDAEADGAAAGLLVPMTGGRLLHVDTVTGEIRRSTRGDIGGPLESLVGHGGRVLTTGPQGASRFIASEEPARGAGTLDQIRYAIARQDYDRAERLLLEADKAAGEVAKTEAGEKVGETSSTLLEHGLTIVRERLRAERPVDPETLRVLARLASTDAERVQLLEAEYWTALRTANPGSALTTLVRSAATTAGLNEMVGPARSRTRVDIWVRSVLEESWPALTEPQREALRPDIMKEVERAAAEGRVNVLVMLSPTGLCDGPLRDAVSRAVSDDRPGAAAAGFRLARRVAAARPSLADALKEMADRAEATMTADRGVSVLQDWSGGSVHIQRIAGLLPGAESRKSLDVDEGAAWPAAREWLFEYDSRLASVVITDPRDGQRQTFLPVPGSVETPFADVAMWTWTGGTAPQLLLDGPDMFVVSGNAIAAYGYPDWKPLWSKEETSSRREVPTVTIVSPLGRLRTPRELRTPISARPQSQVVGVTDVGVVIAQRGRIQCLDRDTGDVLWVRPVATGSSAPIVTPEAVYLVESRTWLRVDAASGRTEVWQPLMPNADYLTTAGKRFVSIHREGLRGPVTLRGWSAESGRKTPVAATEDAAESTRGLLGDSAAEALWERQLADDAWVELLSGGRLLIVRESGTGHIVNLSDGTALDFDVSGSVRAMQADNVSLGQTVCWEDGERVYVFLNRPSESVRMRTFGVFGAEAINGEAFAVSRVDGRVLWEATMPDRVLASDPSRMSPVMVLYGRERQHRGNTDVSTLYLTGVDPRTGDLLFDETFTFAYGDASNFRFDPQARTLETTVDRYRVRVRHRLEE